MSYDPSITFFASFIPMFFSFASLIELAFYIIGSIGLYSMANNTGMKNPWLAWIPVAREYLLGSLADRYNCHFPPEKDFFCYLADRCQRHPAACYRIHPVEHSAHLIDDVFFSVAAFGTAFPGSDSCCHQSCLQGSVSGLRLLHRYGL